VSGNWTCLGTVPELSQHFVDGQSVTLAAPVGKLQLMSRFEPRASRARLTGQGEARRLPDPPRSPAVWRIPPKCTNLIPALAGFLFSDPIPLAHITRLIRSRPVGATACPPRSIDLLLTWQAAATIRALVLHPATTAWISRPPRLARLARPELP
jgi:hypothetical protein